MIRGTWTRFFVRLLSLEQRKERSSHYSHQVAVLMYRQSFLMFRRSRINRPRMYPLGWPNSAAWPAQIINMS
jgi:hypothetical protein